MIDGEQYSEFWNHDEDDRRGSDEDISDSEGISSFLWGAPLSSPVGMEVLLYCCLYLAWLNFSDDTTEAVRSLAGSKLPSHLGLDDKIEFLQRAEERYNQNNISDRQVETAMLCTLVFAVMNYMLGKIMM